MEDRFKCRAYLKDLKVIINIIDISFRERMITTIGNDNFEYTYDFEEIILLQCTGFKDKNSKLIYEGNIVKINNDLICLVIYKEDWGHFVYEVIKGSSRQKHFVMYSAFIKDVEIVEKKFKNLEILEGAKK